LNEQAARALEQQAQSVGRLAVANAAPTMRLIHDGLANAEELKTVFEGARASGNIESMGALVVSPETIKKEGIGRYLEITEKDRRAMMEGDLRPGRYQVPASGTCEVDRGAGLTVRCSQ